MSDFIALRDCRFGANSYSKDDIVPSCVVLPKRRAVLKQYGIIADEPAKPVTPVTATTVITQEQVLKEEPEPQKKTRKTK